MAPVRPTEKELWKKIAKLRSAIASDSWQLASIEKVAPQLSSLGCVTAEETKDFLSAVAEEVEPKSYAGSKPPQKAYEPLCKEAELFAFCWQSQAANVRLYFKFCFVRESLYIVSIHKSEEQS